jgi:endoglucanase
VTFSFSKLLHRVTAAHPADTLDLELSSGLAKAGASVHFAPLDAMVGVRSGDDKSTIVLTAHRDQIGFRISQYDENGFALFVPVGGWDPQILVGQPVVVGRHYQPGVIGRKAIHLLKDGDEKQVVKLENMWIDFGFKSAEEGKQKLPIGSFGVVDRGPSTLANDRFSSRALDDLAGCVVAIEAMGRCTVTPNAPTLVTVLTKHEETIWLGVSGNYVAEVVRPMCIIALDVTFAEDPDTVAKDNNGVKLGGGPVIYHGGMLDEQLTQRIVALAQERKIPYQEAVIGGHSSTDADGMALGGTGQRTLLISIPLRYMHSPVELVDLQDLEHTIQLLQAIHETAAKRDL